jgi:hypothetical protein
MNLRWKRIVVGAFVAELAPFLLLVIVASIYGAVANVSSEAEITAFAERAGTFIGPIGGAIAAFLCARRAVRGSTHPLLSGALLGGIVAVLGITFLVAMRAPFRWIFVFSYTGKLIAACMGAVPSLRRVNALSCDAA